VPEGDTIFRTARTLHRALSGQIVTSFETVFPKLSRVDFDAGIVGRTIEKSEAQGKWLLLHFSNDLILLTHMLMNGSWHIYRPGEKWQRPRADMRIVIATEKILAVAFTIQIAEFHTAQSLRRRSGFNRLGPSVLAGNFDEADAVMRLHSRPDLEVGEALVQQSLVAGLGNIFKSEVCFASGVNPFRKVASLTEKEAACLLSTARKFLLANATETSGDNIATYSSLRRTTGYSNPIKNLWVYERTGKPCRRCGASIESRKQGEGARTTYWCPNCQPMQSTSATILT
jgi:endonuclease VIII